MFTTLNETAAAAAANTGFDISSLLFPVLMVFVIYMMWNSGRKRKRAAAELKTSLTVGTDIILHSGITGKIVSLDDSHAVIETTPKVRIRVVVGAIRGVDSSFETPAATTLEQTGDNATDTNTK